MRAVGVRGLDEEEGYSTVAGLVMHLLRAVPKEGDKVGLWYVAANRDEDYFNEGDRFIADREHGLASKDGSDRPDDLSFQEPCVGLPTDQHHFEIEFRQVHAS